jgi:hypothetical protein
MLVEELINAYESKVKEVTWDGYKLSATGRKVMEKVTDLVTLNIPDAQAVPLMTAAFAVRWFTNVKGEWVQRTYPFPNHLLKTERYLPLYLKLYDNEGEYSEYETILTALKRAYTVLSIAKVESTNYLGILFFLTNNTISLYYGIAQASFIPWLERYTIDYPNSAHEGILKGLQEIENKLYTKGWLLDLRQAMEGIIHV